MTTVSLSTRVSPQARDRLAAAAQARGVPLATYTRSLLEGAQSQPAPGDGPVCNEVECLFHDLSEDAGLDREICLALAREVEKGGSAGIAAGKELRFAVHIAVSRYAPD